MTLGLGIVCKYPRYGMANFTCTFLDHGVNLRHAHSRRFITLICSFPDKLPHGSVHECRESIGIWRQGHGSRHPFVWNIQSMDRWKRRWVSRCIQSIRSTEYSKRNMNKRTMYDAYASHDQPMNLKAPLNRASNVTDNKKGKLQRTKRFKVPRL